MPTVWRTPFCQAALADDEEQMHQLITQIPSEPVHWYYVFQDLNVGLEQLIELT
jgi:hypothetical protein